MERRAPCRGRRAGSGCTLIGVLEGPAVQLDGRDDGRDALRVDLGGARLVGDVGDDLDADPEPGDAREHEAVQAEVEDLLHVAGVDASASARRRARPRSGSGSVDDLRHGIVARQRQHAAVLADARVVGVLEGVAGPVDARRLAVPHAEHAVVLRRAGRAPTIWLPKTAVAPRSSLRPDEKHDVVRAQQRRARARASGRGRRAASRGSPR